MLCRIDPVTKNGRREKPGTSLLYEGELLRVHEKNGGRLREFRWENEVVPSMEEAAFVLFSLRSLPPG